MKKKIKILIVSCIMAAAAVTGFNMAQNSNNLDVSLADIAVMARADGESGGSVDCWWEVERGGSKLIRACQIWSGDYAYGCKWVTDASSWDYLATCNP